MRNSKILFAGILTIILAFSFPKYIRADCNGYKVVVANNSTLRKSEVKWEFKRENGKLYRRLYNVTEKKYMTDWILVK